MSLLQIMKREQTLIRLVVLIFMGGAFNSLALVFSLLEITKEMQSNPSFLQNQIPFITTSPLVTISYLGLGIVFSIGASASFRPRRIVSTTYVQITTATILLIILHVNYYTHYTPTINPQFLGTEIGVIGMYYVLLGLVGWLQHQVVRRILGVNGNRENIDYKTYSLNANYQDIIKIINRRFLDKYELNPKRSEDMLILQSRWGSFVKHVIVIIPDPNYDSKSILAITSYKISHDWLTKPKDESSREGILGPLERMLKLTKSDFELRESKDDAVATNKAISQTLKLTESPFGEIRNYPKRHILMFGAFAVISIGVILGKIFNIINGDTLTNSIVFLVIVFIVEALPLLHEKARERKDIESN